MTPTENAETVALAVESIDPGLVRVPGLLWCPAHHGFVVDDQCPAEVCDQSPNTHIDCELVVLFIWQAPSGSSTRPNVVKTRMVRPADLVAGDVMLEVGEWRIVTVAPYPSCVGGRFCSMVGTTHGNVSWSVDQASRFECVEILDRDGGR